MTDSPVDFSESGLETLRAVMEGRRPDIPMAISLGYRLIEVEHGRVVFEGRPTAAFLNPMGTVHGGWAATVLDSCVACAVHSTLNPGQAYTTLELKVAYHRPLTPEVGLVRAEGKVLSVGRRAGFAEGRLTGPDGNLYASATSTCIVMDAR
ncbi:MAG: PaaI family thioesterase [Brevundimonas sp.]